MEISYIQNMGQTLPGGVDLGNKIFNSCIQYSIYIRGMEGIKTDSSELNGGWNFFIFHIYIK